MKSIISSGPIPQFVYKSSTGKIYICAHHKGLTYLNWTAHKSNKIITTLDSQIDSHKIILNTIKELDLYFAKKIKKFTIPLDPQGTAFQKSVWLALKSIPYGKTNSYADVALKIKKPKAFRAVGSANGKNPICIIIPCHRVVKSDGTIGGFSADLNIKNQLLNLESSSEEMIN